jgi:hypothetical protein
MVLSNFFTLLLDYLILFIACLLRRHGRAYVGFESDRLGRSLHSLVDTVYKALCSCCSYKIPSTAIQFVTVLCVRLESSYPWDDCCANTASIPTLFEHNYNSLLRKFFSGDVYGLITRSDTRQSKICI